MAAETARTGMPAWAARLVAVVWLTLVWVLLWGDASLGTVVAGTVIGLLVVVLLGRGRTPPGLHVRPVRAVLLGVVFLVMLVEATLAVLRQVLRPHIDISPAIVEVALPPAPPAVATIVANAVTLTPGTLSLDLVVAPDESAVLQVHALDAPDPDEVRRDTLRLHALATAAFGRPSDARSPR
jgi:multicomponent Na+:H+ antiporter subunit E